MFKTYIPSSNATTNGVALGNSDSNSDVVVKKILIGAPVATGNIYVYDITNPINGATTNIACKITLPASLPTTGAITSGNIIDFTLGGQSGLQLTGGGNVIIDQTMQVTVLWDYLDSDN